MTASEIFEILNKNPAFTLATVEGTNPRVRGMLLYKADERGVVFHTASDKDVCKQIIKNPNVEMCFFDQAQGIQVRVRGTLEKVDDRKFKEEIMNHPSRAFMQGMKAQFPAEEDFYNYLTVFCLKSGMANVWTFQTNLTPKEDIAL
jgi:uncharacterized pyridoxamine 5'-phosphate oxidase family protein